MKRIVFFLCGCFVVGISDGGPVRPALNRSVVTVDLASDTAWQIRLDEGPWRPIKVPGGGYNSDLQYEPLISSFDVKDHVTYQRTIDIPKGKTGQAVKIEFGGVNHGCDIFLNDTFLLSHVGPIMPFEVDITHAVEPGRQYELKVVSYPLWHYNYNVPHGFVYQEARHSWGSDYKSPTPGYGDGPGWASKFSFGIVKYVRLAVYPEVYLKDVFVRPSVTQKNITCEAWIHNHASEDKSVTLSSEFSSWNGDGWNYPKLKPVEVTIGGNQVKKVTLGPAAWIPGPESYWWPNKPYREDYQAKLHNIKLSIAENGVETDRLNQRFGFVEWAEGPFYYKVNGVRINQIGDGTPEAAMSDYDCYVNSPAFLPPTARGEGCPGSWKKYMRLGINAYRIHQSTPTQYMMDTADELGFMLITESANRGCQQQRTEDLGPYIQAVKEMALYGRNHPSVCRYSLLNEGDVSYVWQLVDAIVTVDDTRPLSFDDDNIDKPAKIEGKTTRSRAYAILHYTDYPKPADMITGMGEFAWFPPPHSYDVPVEGGFPKGTSGMEKFIWCGAGMRKNNLAYFAGWDFINYWPNFLDGMNYEKHAWKQSSYPKDRVDGVDGWNSPVIRWLTRCFHPYFIMDPELHKINRTPENWPQSTDSYPSSGTIERRLEMFNDGLSGNQFSLKWEARWDSADGELVDLGVINNLTIEPGFHKTVSLSLKAPAVESGKRRLYLVLFSNLENREVFRETDIYFWITPRVRIP